MQYKHTCIHVHIIVYISVSWGEKITFFSADFLYSDLEEIRVENPSMSSLGLTSTIECLCVYDMAV